MVTRTPTGDIPFPCSRKRKPIQWLPSFKELGVNVEFYDWYAVFAPAATPPAVLQVLQRALRRATQDPEFVAALGQGNEHGDYLDGDALKTWYARETKWRVDAVRAIGKIDTK